MEKEKFLQVENGEIKEEGTPGEGIKKLEYFLDLKKDYENLKSQIETGEIPDKKLYDETMENLNSMEKELLKWNQEIAKFFKEQKEEIYTYDEILKKIEMIKKIQEN